jgi:hypothetical protein
MKYSLRSLMIAAILGPPLLAGGWVAASRYAAILKYRHSGSPVEGQLNMGSGRRTPLPVLQERLLRAEREAEARKTTP